MCKKFSGINTQEYTRPWALTEMSILLHTFTGEYNSVHYYIHISNICCSDSFNRASHVCFNLISLITAFEVSHYKLISHSSCCIFISLTLFIGFLVFFIDVVVHVFL